MTPKIELGCPSEPIDGVWRWYSCEYSLDDGATWLDGEVQSDGHLMAEETLVDDGGDDVVPRSLPLICAAPAMLAALIDCAMVMERELKGLAVIQPELRNARVAIAKAGGAPIEQTFL